MKVTYHICDSDRHRGGFGDSAALKEEDMVAYPVFTEKGEELTLHFHSEEEFDAWVKEHQT